METATKKRKAAPQTPASVETASTEAKRKPVAILREDDCSASIWARDYVGQGVSKRYYTVSLERSYKERNSGWKYTQSFEPASLGKIASLCQQAEIAIRNLQQLESAA